MEWKESPYFNYEDNVLHAEGVPVPEIVEAVGTPVYIYSRQFLVDRARDFHKAFEEIPHTVFYAMKANYNLSIVRTLALRGCGVDVNSGGELYRALKAEVDPHKILMAGVGKTEEEIRMALKHDILLLKAESRCEVEVINEIAGQLGKKARVALRVNPDVSADTHPYISTGLSSNKFGINAAEAATIFLDKSFDHVEFAGVDMHIGSQITTIGPYEEAITKLVELIQYLKENGLELHHLDVGGGIGVEYQNEDTFTVFDYAKVIIPLLKKTGMHIFFEPGRYMTANGGILVSKVLYNKSNNEKNFVIVDAGMNDLLRPSLYHAEHHIQPVVRKEENASITADVVGPICESGDFLGKDREMPALERGELVAVMSAGAYGMVMSSNYNARSRPPEVLVIGDTWQIVRCRENYEHQIYDELDAFVG